MRRIAVAAVMALVASLLLPGSASAWNQFPCDSGELEADAAWVDGPLSTRAHIPGVVNCGVSTPGPTFIVAVFEFGRDHGYYHEGLTQAYASRPPISPGPSIPPKKTTFEVVGQIIYPQPSNMDPTGLCIMPDEHTRLSCVLVSTDLTFTQLSTSDPLVARVVAEDPGMEPSPNCATCFRVGPRT